MRLCIVTEFEQKDFFQWRIALESDLEIVLDSVVVNPSVLNYYPSSHPFWNTIKKADVVFVYCARHDMGWKWYELPIIVKKLMNPKAKMICQFDLEFLWLWYPNHFPWEKIDQWSDGKTPEEFFAETEVLKVADAYIVFFNSNLKKLISRPVYEIPLPQLVRYETFLSRMKKSFEDKNGNVVILKHSVKSASYEHTLNRVIQKLRLPVTIFTCEHTGSTQKFEMLKKLPSGSRVYGRVSRDGYVDLLEKEFIAVDDNEGYYGWSRFAMECAMVYVPCIGSTLAVKEFFPELYTKRKDYKTQRKLIKKLCDDRKFWIRMAKTGKRNVLRKLNTERLANKFIEVTKVKKAKEPIVRKKTIPKTDVEKRIEKESSNSAEMAEYQRYKRFKAEHRYKTVPQRPVKGAKVYDPCTKDILSQRMWDLIYDRWRQFIEGKIPEEKPQKSTAETFTEKAKKKASAVVLTKKPVKPKPKPESKPEPIKPVKAKEQAKPKSTYKGGVYAPSDPTVATRFAGKEKVIIVIPTYNQRSAVIGVVGRLNSQLTKGDEIIIVDDGSTDGTFHALEKKFPKKVFTRVKVLRQEEHRGLAFAVKVGVMSIKTTHSCGNVILVDPNENIDGDFVSNIMRGLWSRKEGKRRVLGKRKVSKDGKKTICLYASWVHTSNIQPIDDFLRSSKDYDVIWSEPWAYREEKIVGDFPEADVYVTCSSEHRKRLVFDIPKTIYTMHGLSPAELECIPAHELYLFKGVLLPSQWYLDQIKKGVWGIDYKNYPKDFFKIVGWMKGDILFSPEIDGIVEEVKKKFGIDKLPYEKTVVYSPTGFWRMGYSSFAETINPLIDACNYLKVNLIIKLHFSTMNKYEPPKTVGLEAKKRSANMKNIIWIEHRDLQDMTALYKIADVLVSDASSTLLEFLQVDKMGIEMMNRDKYMKINVKKQYWKDVRETSDLLLDWRGFSMPKGSTIKCFDVEDLPRLLTRAIYHPDEFKKDRRKWRKLLFHKLDGKATKRVLKAIEEYMGWR